MLYLQPEKFLLAVGPVVVVGAAATKKSSESVLGLGSVTMTRRDWQVFS
jgi:hypothetical protein